MMKTSIAMVCLGLMFCVMWRPCEAAGDDEIVKGDTAERVREVLGKPDGYIRLGSYELLQYDRGKVTIREGIVTEVDLISAEEAEALKEQREAERAARAASLAELREKLKAEGEAVKESTLSDPVFASLSPQNQVAFWESFRKRYPDVPVDAAYADALARYKEDLEAQQIQEKIRDLERRVARAEDRAETAETEARRAQDSSRTAVYYPPYLLRYYYPAYTVTPNQPPYRHRTVGPWGDMAAPPTSPSYIWKNQGNRSGFSGNLSVGGSYRTANGTGVQVYSSF